MDFNIAGPLSPDEQSQIVRTTVENFNLYLNRWPEPWPVEGTAVEWIGEGCLLRDVTGREFIDCLGGLGIFALGHRHPKVIEAVKAQMDRLPLHSQWMLNPRRDSNQPLSIWSMIAHNYSSVILNLRTISCGRCAHGSHKHTSH